MRETLSNACELAGWAGVAVGAWFICPWLVVVWVGLTLMLIGYVMGPE